MFTWMRRLIALVILPAASQSLTADSCCMKGQRHVRIRSVVMRETAVTHAYLSRFRACMSPDCIGVFHFGPLISCLRASTASVCHLVPALHMSRALLLHSLCCCRVFDNKMNLAIHVNACLIHARCNLAIFSVVMQGF